jgi:glycolate oxidase FAD binding subunit
MPDLVPVVTPERDELMQLVQELHASASPWVPSGFGNHLHWGAALQPDAGPTLSMARINRVLQHAVDDFTVTVEAGLPISQLQLVLAEKGQWLPLDPPVAGPSSIGGLVARGLSGRLQHHYRGLRDQLLGLSLLRSDGTAAKAGGRVVKNVAGYDLMRLFAGSWGSLGLISEITLRTMPLPQARRLLRVSGRLLQLQELRQQLLLHSPLALEFIQWRQGPGAAALMLGLVSLDNTELQHQQQQLQQLLPPGLELDHCNAEAEQPVTADQWLLRLGLEPVQVCSLLQSAAAMGWQLQLGAASGIGLGLAKLSAMAPYKVETLRRTCKQLGGYLTVLQGPSPHPIAAWEDAPSRRVIEAVKHQFDPLQQLCRGRLPGVCSN